MKTKKQIRSIMKKCKRGKLVSRGKIPPALAFGIEMHARSINAKGSLHNVQFN